MLKRFDTIVVEINAWLLAVAIGLATLDATAFLAAKLPPATANCAACARHADEDVVPPTAEMSMLLWGE
jgi:hypothetical protein